ncbi:MAG: nuclear transport factor 2 family protein [Acidimicrobiales bacterium]
MDNATLLDRFVALEDRVRCLEDQAALVRLIASWGPAADTANGQAASWFWTEDAVLETESTRHDGASGVRAMIDGEGQQALVQKGCAHVQGVPIVRIDGDRAMAINYGRVYLHAEDGYEIWRVSVNCWEFRRTVDGWRVTRRRAHVIDGGPEARDLLSQAIDVKGVS